MRDSFYVGNDQFRVDGKKIRLPKLGWVRMRESLRFAGKILSATIFRIAVRWFVSINVQLESFPNRCESQTSVGIDLGVKALATLSTGEQIEGPKSLKKYLKKLKRLQQSLSRKQKGSKNRTKARNKIARLHYRIACIRKDALHKLTTMVTGCYRYIVIEDLNVNGMLKNGKLARAISDMGFFELRRQLDYKAQLYGNTITVADRWFPSTKTCSKCGHVKQDITLFDRVFMCGNCGLQIDRDLNAAINLQQLAQINN